MLNPADESKDRNAASEGRRLSRRAEYIEPHLKNVGTVEQLTRAVALGGGDGFDGDIEGPGGS